MLFYGDAFAAMLFVCVGCFRGVALNAVLFRARFVFRGGDQIKTVVTFSHFVTRTPTAIRRGCR